MVSCGFDGMVRSLSLQWSAGLPGLLEDADVYIDMTCIIYIYIHIQSYCMILCMYVYPHYPPYRLQLISLCQYSYVSWFTICMKTSLRYHKPKISVLTQHGRQPWISLIPNLGWVVKKPLGPLLLWNITITSKRSIFCVDYQRLTMLEFRHRLGWENPETPYF